MLGRNRVKKIERLFNIKFEIFSNVYGNYKHGYISYLNQANGIMIYIYVNKICVSFGYKFCYIKNEDFQKVLQLIHEYLYDSRDNNKR